MAKNILAQFSPEQLAELRRVVKAKVDQFEEDLRKSVRHATAQVAGGGATENIAPDKINPKGTHKAEKCAKCGKMHGLEKCGDMTTEKAILSDSKGNVFDNGRHPDAALPSGAIKDGKATEGKIVEKSAAWRSEARSKAQEKPEPKPASKESENLAFDEKGQVVTKPKEAKKALPAMQGRMDAAAKAPAPKPAYSPSAKERVTIKRPIQALDAKMAPGRDARAGAAMAAISGKVGKEEMPDAGGSMGGAPMGMVEKTAGASVPVAKPPKAGAMPAGKATPTPKGPTASPTAPAVKAEPDAKMVDVTNRPGNKDANPDNKKAKDLDKAAMSAGAVAHGAAVASKQSAPKGPAAKPAAMSSIDPDKSKTNPAAFKPSGPVVSGMELGTKGPQTYGTKGPAMEGGASGLQTVPEANTAAANAAARRDAFVAPKRPSPLVSPKAAGAAPKRAGIFGRLAGKLF